MGGELSVYVWQLPVTTELTRRESVDQYGYPKFLAGEIRQLSLSDHSVSHSPGAI